MTLIYLFLEFIKTGLFSVGGGLATIPFLKEIAQNYDWFTVEQLIDMIAVSESTPGPIGINMSTFAGFQAGGFLGALVATISIVIPPIIIILIVSKILEKFKTNKYVNKVFTSLRPASTGLILGAMMDIFILSFFYNDKMPKLRSFQDFFDWFSFENLASITNFKGVIFFIIAFIIIRKFKKFHPIVFILGGMLFGIVLNL